MEDCAGTECICTGACMTGGGAPDAAAAAAAAATLPDGGWAEGGTAVYGVGGCGGGSD